MEVCSAQILSSNNQVIAKPRIRPSQVKSSIKVCLVQVLSSNNQVIAKPRIRPSQVKSSMKVCVAQVLSSSNQVTSSLESSGTYLKVFEFYRN